MRLLKAPVPATRVVVSRLPSRRKLAVRYNQVNGFLIIRTEPNTQFYWPPPSVSSGSATRIMVAASEGLASKSTLSGPQPDQP